MENRETSGLLKVIAACEAAGGLIILIVLGDKVEFLLGATILFSLAAYSLFLSFTKD